MTDLLNIDEIKPRVLKRIKLNGREHDMVAPSVKAFLSEIQEAEAIEKRYGDSVPMHIAIESVIRFVASVFPTVPVEELKALSFEQLNAIRELVQLDSAPPAEIKEAEGNA